MNLEFHTDDERIEIYQTIPEELQRLHIPGTIPFYLPTPFGRFLFQRFQEEGFCCAYNRGNGFGNGHIHTRGPETALEYRSCLTGQLEGKWDGICSSGLLPRTFNFSSTSEIITTAKLRPGREYAWFDIQFERPYLQRFAETHADFRYFLKQVDAGQPVQLSKIDYTCSDRMMDAINGIIYSYYDPVLRAMTLEPNVTIILAEAFHVAFHKVQPPPEEIILEPHEYDQIRKVHFYIVMESFNNHLTNGQLCEKFKVRKAVLHQGFRKLYKTTPQKLVHQTRYDQIKILLLQGHTPTEVARMAQFENVSYFSRLSVTTAVVRLQSSRTKA